MCGVVAPPTGGVLAPGRMTGANALFCLTALNMLAALKEKIPAAAAPEAVDVNPALLDIECGNVGDWEGTTVAAAKKETKKPKMKIGSRVNNQRH